MKIGDRVHLLTDIAPTLFTKAKAGTVKTFRHKRAYVAFDDGGSFWCDMDYLHPGNPPNYMRDFSTERLQLNLK